MSHGVEWALHCCLDLVWLAEEDRPVPTARLAEFHDLAPAYLNKHLQALARAGILGSTPGKRGGFRLARRPDKISLLDVVTAVEGPDPAFRCLNIRNQGPGDAVMGGSGRRACVISHSMRRAELTWRRELAGTTLADLAEEAQQHAADVAARTRRWFADA
ncbi:Rrf2 family transcriptional regulator [Streptomyces sp. NPDC046203]|uniref:RrF2 family transcriptional regulator n=1 Tax=Streptomyces sp. NPDC046203 TaxID=3154602 RepID=UPI0033DBAABE